MPRLEYRMSRDDRKLLQRIVGRIKKADEKTEAYRKAVDELGAFVEWYGDMAVRLAMKANEETPQP